MNLASFDLPRYLSVLPLFAGLGPAALRRLADACHLRRLAPQDMVFSVGQPCHSFHVAVLGHVKLFALSPGGQEKVIELVGPGCAFEEAPVFTGQPHVVNAQALTDSLLLAIEKDCVLAEVGANPHFALSMLTNVSHRLDGLMRNVEAGALHSGLQRVIDYLLRHQSAPARGWPAMVSLPVSKATIASMLSITPEYLSRMLRTLESAQLIQMDKRDIRILDSRRLAAYPPVQPAPAPARAARSAPLPIAA